MTAQDRDPAAPWGQERPCSGFERKRHALRLAEIGSTARQTETDVGRRNSADKAVLRLREAFPDRLTARTFCAQIAEMNVATAVANGATRASKPMLVRMPRPKAEGKAQPTGAMQQGRASPIPR